MRGEFILNLDKSSYRSFSTEEEAEEWGNKYYGNWSEEYKSNLIVKKRKGDRYPLFLTHREYMPHVFTSREHTQRGRSALLKSILQSVQLNRNDSRRNCRRKQSHSDGSTKTFEFQTMNDVYNVISCA